MQQINNAGPAAKAQKHIYNKFIPYPAIRASYCLAPSGWVRTLYFLYFCQLLILMNDMQVSQTPS